jgi:predicted NBD/HSP70 family sugar kinase
MSKILKGSFELMKQLNISAVLNVIKNNGGLSRADIAKLTGLTPASISNISKQLIESKYLVERGMGESSGGRPPIILELNPDARYVIGVNIGVGSIEVVVTDLGAKIICRDEMLVLASKRSKELVIKNLVKLINEVLMSSNIDSEKVLGVGIAMHGIVNTDNGISKYAPYYNWVNVNLKEELQSILKYPVFIDNDVRAMAIGESWFGSAKDINNFVMINVSNGVGAGIIIENKPYYGVDFSAGEIGHIVVDVDGAKCNCGNYGCLETVVSNDSIVKKAIKAIKQGSNSLLINFKENIEDLTIDDICKGASLNDDVSIYVLKEAARYLGMGISNLVNILNPRNVVVVGEIFEDTLYVIEALKEIVDKRSMRVPNKNIRITKSVLGKEAAVIGAATLVIKELFSGNEALFNS